MEKCLWIDDIQKDKTKKTFRKFTCEESLKISDQYRRKNNVEGKEDYAAYLKEKFYKTEG